MNRVLFTELNVTEVVEREPTLTQNPAVPFVLAPYAKADTGADGSADENVTVNAEELPVAVELAAAVPVKLPQRSVSVDDVIVDPVAQATPSVRVGVPDPTMYREVKLPTVRFPAGSVGKVVLNCAELTVVTPLTVALDVDPEKTPPVCVTGVVDVRSPLYTRAPVDSITAGASKTTPDWMDLTPGGGVLP
jgi:hypothetical protein